MVKINTSAKTKSKTALTDEAQIMAKGAKVKLEKSPRKLGVAEVDEEDIREKLDDDSDTDEEAEHDASDDDSDDEEMKEEGVEEKYGIDENGSESDDDEAAEDFLEDEKVQKQIIKTAGAPASSSTQFKTGYIPSTIPINQIICVTNIPASVQQHDIAQVFEKYGDIDTIYILARGTRAVAQVAFKSADAAKAALAANGVANIKKFIAHVTPKQPNSSSDEMLVRKRAVLVTTLKPNTTEQQLREHFASCGTIEKIQIKKTMSPTAVIVFPDEQQVKLARKLNHSVLNGITMHVQQTSDKLSNSWDYDCPKNNKLTVVVSNTAHLDAFSMEKLHSIFSECGVIDFADILCRTKILAFVTFKKESAALKALEMDGTTVDGLELGIRKFDSAQNKIQVINIKEGVTEEELRNHFEKCGEIHFVLIKKDFAIITFKSPDAYCKSFLLDESILHKQRIFVTPFSEQKKAFLSRQLHQKRIKEYSRKKRHMPSSDKVYSKKIKKPV